MGDRFLSADGQGERRAGLGRGVGGASQPSGRFLFLRFVTPLDTEDLDGYPSPSAQTHAGLQSPETA